MHATDDTVEGMKSYSADPLRYDGQSDDPHEVAGVLKALMPAGIRVLDVGCGTGSVTLIANSKKGNLVLAIEPDVTRCELARTRGIECVNSYLDKAFVDRYGQFDVVMSSDVLEHMVDPVAGVQSFLRALKPTGQLLISVPNVAHWTVRANLILGRFQYEETGIMDATHLRWFTRQTIIKLLIDQGLEIIAIKPTAGYDLPVYNRGVIGRLPKSFKRRFLRKAIRVASTWFAVQYVVMARRQP